MEAPRLSKHARTRAYEMGLTYQQVQDVVLKRSITYASTKKHDNNGLVVQSNAVPGVAVIWDPVANFVLTVLHRTTETYVRPEKQSDVLDSAQDEATKEKS